MPRSLVSIVSLFGGVLGVSIIFVSGYWNIITGIISFTVFSVIFGLIADLLNKKGYLVNIMQVVGSLVAFAAYYIILLIPCYLLGYIIGLDESVTNSISIYLPIPLSILLVIRKMKKLNLKFRRITDEELESIELENRNI